MRHFIRKDKGNALIMGALSFAVLAAFGVLTIDIGRIMLTKNQLQNGADAAALAGASVYCEDANATDEAAQARAHLVGESNSALGLGAAEPIKLKNVVITTTEGGGHRVDVTTASTTAQYFLGVLQFAQDLKGSGAGAAKSTDVEAVAAAQCGATCGVKCIKPWSPPDRWDDVTPIPGYDGKGGKKAINWANNNQWDGEPLTNDVNGNGLYDPGDGFTDGNNNGKYDCEKYDPNLTGYIPDPIPGNMFAPSGDLGREITLDFNNQSAPVPGQYQPVDLPPINRGNPITGADAFRDNIANCNQSEVWPGDWLATENGAMVGPTNQGMRELIGQDPNAEWDPITQSVINSNFAISPRIVLIPMYDPRIFPHPGKMALQVTKVAAFFMEKMSGNGTVTGRFLKVRAPGEPCVAFGGAGGGVVSFTYSLSLIK